MNGTQERGEEEMRRLAEKPEWEVHIFIKKKRPAYADIRHGQVAFLQQDEGWANISAKALKHQKQPPDGLSPPR